MTKARTDSLLLWGGLLLALAIFGSMPTVDLAVSSLFYTPGVGFAHAQDPWVRASYDWTPLIGRVIVGGLALFALTSPLLARLMADRQMADRCRGPWRRAAAVAVLCGVLGPGLVVEVWFKNAAGRPRPVHVTAFGGDQAFRGPLQPGPDPAQHRSFASSHAAAGFWLLSLGLGCGTAWRRRWLFIGLATGALVGLGRIMQGGHFLSDVVFAFYAVWVPCEILVALGSRMRRQSVKNLKSSDMPHLG